MWKPNGSPLSYNLVVMLLLLSKVILVADVVQLFFKCCDKIVKQSKSTLFVGIIGLRVVNVYDIDNKTYLIRLSSADQKIVLLVESGNRMHTTEFSWPKNMMPSGFSMKCRKHLKGRRLSSINQLGIDRIVDLSFGYGEAAYHLIVELYDRGNIILTDYEYTILQLLRVRTDTEDVRFAVREKYPVDKARQEEPLVTLEKLKEFLENGKSDEPLKKLLNPHFVYGPALLEHCFLEVGLNGSIKIGQGFKKNEDIDKLMAALEIADQTMKNTSDFQGKGYILQKKEKKPSAISPNDGEEELLTYQEFHPFLFNQHKTSPAVEFPTFDKAVDEFFSKLEAQKLDMKTLAQEKAALKKLENVRQDHQKRLEALQKAQDDDTMKSELIEINLTLVDQAIKVINSAIANQIDWEEIHDIVKEAQSNDDPVASAIKDLQLETNQITMILRNPYDFATDSNSSSEDVDDDDEKHLKTRSQKEAFKPVKVDINLGMTAFANSRFYHNKRKMASKKEQKTVDASKMALKSAEKKTKQTLKEVATSAVINKARKTYWFEKFLWFISSENFIILAGRDQQQNEVLVKKYLRPGDLYVHADLHGASSVIIKNPSRQPVPHRTLNEAGTMAICYSAAWDAKVVTSAWYVYHDQVSKTAPSGEYLTTGSFMIRGKKTFLPPRQLMMGFGILFKLDETCVMNHLNERKPKLFEDDSSSVTTENADLEIKLEESDSESEERPQSPLSENSNEIILSESNVEETSNGNDIEETVNENSAEETLNDKSNCDQDSNREELNKENDQQNKINKEQERTESGKDIESSKELEESSDFYPDTSIQLQYVSGERYQLQRGVSSSAVRHGSKNGEDESAVHLGDSEKVETGSRPEPERKPRLSAKQRRDLKKKSKQEKLLTTEEDTVGPADDNERKQETNKHKNDEPKAKPNQAEPKKRGQKGKQKKMKEKYKDQDEEEKELMLEILASSGKPKEMKGKHKGKKGSKTDNSQQKLKSGKQNKVKQQINPELLFSDDTPENNIENTAPDNQDTKENVEDEDDEMQRTGDDTEKENISVLDSLTGSPQADDLLMFAIPVCAPYSTLQNYKALHGKHYQTHLTNLIGIYTHPTLSILRQLTVSDIQTLRFKVKITPGTGRRGKAAKTALHLFSMAKDTTQREKDLFRSLKDVDNARNLPGKVKLSAPNLQKAKK